MTEELAMITVAIAIFLHGFGKIAPGIVADVQKKRDGLTMNPVQAIALRFGACSSMEPSQILMATVKSVNSRINFYGFFRKGIMAFYGIYTQR